MYVELTTSEVVSRLLADEYAGWTYEEARALAEYYEDYEDSTGEKIEFDPVSIRGEWTAFDDWRGAAESWNLEAACEDEAVNALESETEVILVEGGGLLVREF